MLGAAFAIGLTSLSYQIVWERLLKLHFGGDPLTATLSIGTLLLGYGLGASWCVKKSASLRRLRHWILFSCLFGLASYPLIVSLAHLVSFGVTDLSQLRLRLLLASVACLAPGGFCFGVIHTFLFALTPSLGRPKAYAANVLGAAAGILMSLYLLLPYALLPVILIVLALIDGLIWGALKRRTDTVAAGSVSVPRSLSGAHLVAVATGFLGAAYEVLLVRIANAENPSSAYNYPYVLFACLVFMAIGAQRSSRKKTDSGMDFTWGAITACVAAVLGYLLMRQLTGDIWIRGRFSALLIVILSTPFFFWGSLFPRLLMGGDVQRIIALNAVGAFVGALGLPILMIPGVGAVGAWTALVLGSCVIACWLERGSRKALALMFVTAVCVMTVRPLGRYFVLGQHAMKSGRVDLVEGETGTAWFVENSDGTGEIRISGQKMCPVPIAPQTIAQIATTLAIRSRGQVLMLGLGGSNYLPALLKEPGIESVTIVEWSKELPTLLRRESVRHFLGNPLEDPRVKLYWMDARMAIATFPPSHFDLVLDNMGPVRWSGATHTKSTEFFAEVKRILKQDGIYFNGGIRASRVEVAAGLMKNFPDVVEWPSAATTIAGVGFPLPAEKEVNLRASTICLAQRQAFVAGEDCHLAWPKPGERRAVIKDCAPLRDNFVGAEYFELQSGALLNRLYGYCG